MDIRGVPIAERTDLITSSQVIRGVDEKNQKVFAKTVSQSNSDGVAKIFFDNLRPGSRYVMYVSATSPQGYEPIIYGEEVTRL